MKVLRLSSSDLLKMKKNKQKIVALTAYDYSFASIADGAGVDFLLVGDSLGMVVYGYENTLRVTLEQIISHGKAVVKGSSRAYVVVDMPFMSYQVSIEDAIRNAGKIMSETGANAVKFEGADIELTQRLTEIGIPVVGHLGYTPQSVKKFGRNIIRGKEVGEQNSIIDAAKALEKAGAVAIVLESVPEKLAKEISDMLFIPIIGIGSGRFCDGEIQVIYDILGIYPDFVPKHTKIFKNVGRYSKNGIKEYVKAVRDGNFPGEKNIFKG